MLFVAAGRSVGRGARIANPLIAAALADSVIPKILISCHSVFSHSFSGPAGSLDITWREGKRKARRDMIAASIHSRGTMVPTTSFAIK